MSDGEEEISNEEEKKLINDIVKSILVLDYTKKPFKQSDISKFLSKKPTRKIWNSSFNAAVAKLKDMGYSLFEVKNPGSKIYILTSSLFPLPSMYKSASESEQANRTLLILVLTYIFMKDGSVTDVDLFNHLKELKIYSEENSEHEYFGNVKKKILNDFPNQLYLEKIKITNTEGFQLEWGERAQAEVSKMSILKFVCEVGYEGSIKPENLASQYMSVMEEEDVGNNGDDELMVVDT